MKKVLNFIFVCMVMLMTTVSFTSCSQCDEDDDDVSLRMYNTYVVGAWILSNEEGYADFNGDGIKESFNAEIWNDEVYSTVLVFKSDYTCEMVPFRNGRYAFEHSQTCRYSISNNYLRIYGSKGYDKTYTIEVFRENTLKLMFVDQGSMVVFTFKYLYDDFSYELLKWDDGHGGRH